MPWITIAATVDNIIISAADDSVLLEAVAENDFDVIVKTFKISDIEYHNLKSGNLSWRIRFNNVRSVYLESFNKTVHQHEMSEIYSRRLKALTELRGKLEHAITKHKTLFTQQFIVYEAKVSEAKDILSNPDSSYIDDGFVRDYAEEANIDIRTAAQLIIIKHTNWYEHLRKIERLRIRHFNAIKQARTAVEFTTVAASIDKDFFTNMLL